MKTSFAKNKDNVENDDPAELCLYSLQLLPAIYVKSGPRMWIKSRFLITKHLKFVWKPN